VFIFCGGALYFAIVVMRGLQGHCHKGTAGFGEQGSNCKDWRNRQRYSIRVSKGLIKGSRVRTKGDELFTVPF